MEGGRREGKGEENFAGFFSERSHFSCCARDCPSVAAAPAPTASTSAGSGGSDDLFNILIDAAPAPPAPVSASAPAQPARLGTASRAPATAANSASTAPRLAAAPTSTFGDDDLDDDMPDAPRPPQRTAAVRAAPATATQALTQAIVTEPSPAPAPVPALPTPGQLPPPQNTTQQVLESLAYMRAVFNPTASWSGCLQSVRPGLSFGRREVWRNWLCPNLMLAPSLAGDRTGF